MKAAVYHRTGGPEVLQYEDVDDPVLHPQGLLVKVEAISIEGGDTLNRLGGVMTSTPHIVGYQCGGTVISVGAEVTDRQVGQRRGLHGQWLARRAGLGSGELHVAGARGTRHDRRGVRTDRLRDRR